MAEHGIEERLVDVEGVRTANGRGETAARWRVMLGDMVCDAFGVRMIQIPRRGRSEVEFIGKVPRPEIGAYAFDVLRRQLESDRRKFLRGLRCRRATKTRRGDLFAEGWISAVRGKVERLAPDEDEERIVEEWIGREHPLLEDMEYRARGGRPGLGDVSAFSGGRSAGRRARLTAGVDATESRALEAGGR